MLGESALESAILKALLEELASDAGVTSTSLLDALRGLGFERAGFLMASVDEGRPRIDLDRLEELGELDLSTWRKAFVAGDHNAQFFDPMKPEANQRDRVISLLETFGPRGPRQETLRRLGLDLEVTHITRVLVCDGDRLLAWVGGTHSEPLTAEARQAFENVIPALRHRFIVERKLREAALGVSGLALAFERIAAPAFIVRAGGRLEHSNRVGASALAKKPAEVREALAAAVDGFERGDPDRSDVSRLPGLSAAHWLVIFREGVVDARVGKAASGWGLTARQREVLQGIVGGEANKTIASRLSCTEATVEAHATAIYRKARVDSRSALIAKLLSS